MITRVDIITVVGNFIALVSVITLYKINITCESNNMLTNSPIFHCLDLMPFLKFEASDGRMWSQFSLLTSMKVGRRRRLPSPESSSSASANRSLISAVPNKLQIHTNKYHI